jgi:orotidine-5'-phosphate decarboxylase
MQEDLMKSTYRGTFATLALLLASVTAVPAQERAGQGGGSGMGVASGVGVMGAGMMTQIIGLAEHLEGRIAFLKTELKITDAQQSQWNAFADALRNNAKKVAAMKALMPAAGQSGSMTAPERFERIDKIMTGMSEIVRSTKAAVDPLYAVLTPEQKKTADALLRGPMGMNPGRTSAM